MQGSMARWPLAILAALTLHFGAATADGTQTGGTADHVAVQGYDVVSYFTDGKPVKGSPAHEVSFDDAKWWFKNAIHQEMFNADPERYLPQYGGYCAWAVSQGYTAKGDPHVWRIVGGKLYVNYNASVQRTWEKDIPGHISRGEKNWPAVLAK